ncbi:MAG: fumarylacetoacetate hydrolase family protein [Gemmatimonadaceae bacterium]|jgi:2-keto-4-pentenoate hydratase/2-oxohepta-3-ene-1,7-dioic acid hydratase in catechol pathway|nr:fumarylacetoacetate hydrolase family protein [Gemmatimonadaceae bacterium]
MRLIRWGDRGRERAGIMLGDARRDVSHLVGDYTPAVLGSDELARLAQAVADGGDALPVVPDDARWGACVPRPGKIICVGLNYRDHAAETGARLPAEPILFMKAPNTMVGPYDTLLIPRGSVKTDWEVELGVVIGREASYLESPDAAAAHVAGWCCCHDVSERTFQLERGGQWTKGKSCDTFAPTGPWLATPDEIADVRALRLWLEVNGERMQDGTTADMAFDPYHLVWYVSQFMTLEPGDLISTGTPAGVGLGMKPERYLRAGDVVTLGIDGLGTQRQLVGQA